ncbi:MAG: leucine-rich repeat protein [Oscillospiraceae bacterium]|nr:leucine-rich repeat protein [Oscillospiraceae bacterium]
MNRIRRRLAGFLAGTVLLTGWNGGLQLRSLAPAEPMSAEHFWAQLQTRPPQEHTGRFTELCYSQADETLQCDGKTVGADFGGFSVRNGMLKAEQRAVLTQAELDQGLPQDGFVSLEAAAERIGCTVTQRGGSLCVTSPFQTGTLIVKAGGSFDACGGQSVAADGRGLHVLQYPTAADAYSAYQQIVKEPHVIYAEPERILHTAEAPAGFSSADAEADVFMWGYAAVDTDAFKAQLDADGNPANEVVVALIDTGVNEKHDWLKGRIAPGGMSFTEEGVGYTDDHGHGSHTGGIIAHSTRENVKILPLKALDASGNGTSLEVYCAMLYAAEYGADVVNMSLGGIGDSLLIQEAAAVLDRQEIPCVVAAGNDAANCKYGSPACIDSVVTVSAVKTDINLLEQFGFFEPEPEMYSLADFSDFGDGIDFAAPGDSILSASFKSFGELYLKSGTSMAAPYVAACFANLADYDPELTFAERYDLLKKYAVDLGEPGFDDQFGHGMVCLRGIGGGAVQQLISAPSASVTGGTYDGPFPVTLSCDEPGAVIYYTTDGSVPDLENGMLYEEGAEIEIACDTVLNAVAFTETQQSRMLSVSYVIELKAPGFSAAPGRYEAGTELDITLYAAAGTDIYYTLDGSEPDPETAHKYDGREIPVRETTVIRAIAVLGSRQSPEAGAGYMIGEEGADRLILLRGTVLEGYYGGWDVLNLSELVPDTALTELAPRVLAGHRELETVILPDSVTKIGAECFVDCFSLKTVTAKGVTEIGAGAFENCRGLVQAELPLVTVIPDAAFRNCTNLEAEYLSAEQIVSVGEYAFSGAGLKGEIRLPNLESAGEGAFSLIKASVNLIFSEKLTEIPDKMCAGTALEDMTAPGVTVIGDYYLGDEETGREFNNPGAFALTYEKITRAGAYAFGGACFGEGAEFGTANIRFDALESAGKGAFQNSSFGIGYFPRLKNVPDEMFRDTDYTAVYLERAETVGDYAFCSSWCKPIVVLGDSLTRIGKLTAGAFEQIRLIAGPDHEFIREMVSYTDIPYVVTPSLMITDEIDDVLHLNEDRYVSAIPLGFGAEVVWEQEENQSGDGSCRKFRLPTEQAGTFDCKCFLMRNGEKLAEKTLTFTVEDQNGTVIFAVGKPYLIPMPKQHSTSARMAYLQFWAEDDGTYYFSSNAGTTKIYLSTSTPDSADYQLVQCDTAPVSCDLKCGDIAFLALEQLDDAEYTSFCVSAEPPEHSLGADGSMKLEHQYYPAGSDLTKLSAAVTAGGETLTEGKDYVLCTAETENGASVCCALGTGRFYGMLSDEIRFYEDYQAGTELQLKNIGRSRQYFRITDAPAGTLICSLTLRENALRRLANGGDAANRLLRTVSVQTEICDENGKNIGRLPDAENGTAVSFTAASDGEYYLSVWNTSDGCLEDAVLKSVSGKANYCIANCEISSTECRFTGSPCDPGLKIRNSSGIVLKEGTDYQVVTVSNVLPGFMTSVITGTGQYYGMAAVKTGISHVFRNAASISADSTFSCGSGCHLFLIWTEHGRQYLLNSEQDGREYDICYYPVGDAALQDTEESAWRNDNVICSGDVVEGCGYAYLMIRNQYEPTLFSFSAIDDSASINDFSAASVIMNDMVFTGAALTPKPTVMLDGKVLQEGVDYTVNVPELVAACGTYQLTLVGTGSLTGIRKVVFSVVMPEQTEIPLLRGDLEKTETAAANHALLYRWIPETYSYVMKKKSAVYVRLQVLNENGMAVGDCSGIGTDASEVKTEPGKVYYITVSPKVPEQEAELEFSLHMAGKLIADCEITGETFLPYSADRPYPDITVRDGGRLLTEGTDYTLLRNQFLRTGYNEILVRGAGDYAGETTFSYVLYPDLQELLPELTPEYISAGESCTATCSDPEDRGLYVFTAPSDGTYYLEAPAHENCGVVFLVYDENMQVYPYHQIGFSMKKGESIRVLVLRDWLENDFGQTVFFRITENAPVVQFESDGYGYLIEDGYASVISLPPNQLGYVLPDVVTDPETGISGEVNNIMNFLTMRGRKDIFYGNVTIYGNKGGSVEAYCREYGYCFAALDPVCRVRGDITGDDLVNEDDIRTLIRFITECAGIMLPGKAAEAADLDGDGIITILDAAIMAKIASQT